MKITERKLENVNCAAKLFKEKGYSAVTMRDIAHALDIKAASLYNHIKSKQEILVLIIIEIAEEFTNVMNKIVTSEITSVQKIQKVIIVGEEEVKIKIVKIKDMLSGEEKIINIDDL